jgi:hypothetical protein
MKAFIFTAIAIGIIFVSCGKGNASKPQISIESITTLIPVNGEFDTKLKFTDKQGDLGGGTFVALRVRLNTQPFPPADSLATSYQDTIPSFPNSSTGQFEFTLDAGRFQEQTQRNDTLLMKFVVIDRGGNASDTITSPMIVALYQ